MTESADATTPAGGRDLRWFARRILYPALVIAAIAAVIWWLDARDDTGTSSTGARYGPVDLPAEYVTVGLSVSPETGSLAPDFLLETLNPSAEGQAPSAEGQAGEARLSDFRGQAVVLNFWASWCAPCRKEMPQFVQAYERYKDRGLVVIGLNLQEGSRAGKFAEDFGIEFPVLMDRDGEVGDRYRVLGLPTTLFIDREGVVRSVFTGPFEGEEQGTRVQGAIADSELEARIAAILAPAAEGE